MEDLCAFRLFACDCAERTVHLCGDDPRPAAAISVARRFAIGEATADELAAAGAAARNAARDAARYCSVSAAAAARWYATLSAVRCTMPNAEAAASAAAMYARTASCFGGDWEDGRAERTWQQGQHRRLPGSRL